MNRVSTQKIVYIAVMTALTAVFAQISIPLPSGVPVTLQIFAVAVAGYLFGVKGGLAVVGAYILLGATGAPVFASFTGGAAKLIGVTGGFIWGFLPLAALSGLGAIFSRNQKSKSGISVGSMNGRSKTDLFAARRARFSAVLFGLLGLLCCHALGVLQFCLVSGTSAAEGIALASLPYIFKDALLVVAAEYCAAEVKKRLPAIRAFS